MSLHPSNSQIELVVKLGTLNSNANANANQPNCESSDYVLNTDLIVTLPFKKE